MLLTKNEARLLLFIIISISVAGLLGSSVGAVGGQSTFGFSLSLNGYSISVAPNHSGYVEVNVGLVSGPPQNVTLTSSISPQDSELSTSFAQSSGIPPFVTTLIVNVLNAQPGKQYQVTVAGTSQGLSHTAPVLTVTISCTQGTCSATLTTATSGQGSVVPSCPSGCQETVGHVVNVTATPAASWTFSGWNVTGVSCSNGPNANPCSFTMPDNSLSITANFIQYQTLYTSYTGDGQIIPSCATGCQEPVGYPVSIVATPASGWEVSGYHLTSGVACGTETGYVCTFAMPNFPVSFQVAFTATTITITTSVTVPSTIKTSVTSTTVVGSVTTSTVTTSSTSVTTTGQTTTTTIYSTSSVPVIQTQSTFSTQSSTLTANVTTVTMSIENPLLELTLAIVIFFSVLVIGINLVRRSRHPPFICGHCGFNNPMGRKYCVNCGKPLKEP